MVFRVLYKSRGDCWIVIHEQYGVLVRQNRLVGDVSGQRSWAALYKKLVQLGYLF